MNDHSFGIVLIARFLLGNITTLRKIWIEDIDQIASLYSLSQDILQHIWTIINKNTKTWERSAIEIDERKDIQDIFIDK